MSHHTPAGTLIVRPSAIRRIVSLALLVGLAVAPLATAADPSGPPIAADPSGAPEPTGPPTAAESKSYDLKYRFTPGETVRWGVEHRADVQTTINGSSQTAETLSRSVKAWRVVDVADNGNVSFEHFVESVDMRQKFSGRQEVTYNSKTDETPPPGFEDAAKSVGVVLSKIVLDERGKVVNREHKAGKQSATESPITITLPSEPISIGHVWINPHEITVSLQTGSSKMIQTRQRFTFESVSGSIATIGVETQVLTPISDPKIEAQLVHQETKGTVRFDMSSGRIVSQQMDLDKSVVGAFGPTSSVHYKSRFTETLLRNENKTARRKRAPGPAIKATVNK